MIWRKTETSKTFCYIYTSTNSYTSTSFSTYKNISPTTSYQVMVFCFPQLNHIKLSTMIPPSPNQI